MDFKQLKSFVVVAREESFSKAADMLYLSQPAISCNVQKLEKHLGIALFDRGNNGVTLTQGGVLFYKYAMEVLNMCEKAEQAVKEYKNTVEGVLEIYSSSIPEQHLLPYIVKDFLKLHPGVRFSIRHKDSREVVEHILSGDINLGIIGAKYTLKSLEYEDFYKDRLVMIASPEKEFKIEPLDIGILAGENVIMREEGSGTKLLVEQALKKKGLDWSMFENRTVSDSMEAIVKMVELNMGISFISEVAVKHQVKSGRLCKYEIRDLDLRRSFNLVYCKNRCLSPAEERFREFISSWKWDSLEL